jgi:hypothetical protein
VCAHIERYLQLKDVVVQNAFEKLGKVIERLKKLSSCKPNAHSKVGTWIKFNHNGP